MKTRTGRLITVAAVAAAGLAAASCADLTTASRTSSSIRQAALEAAFTSVPQGYGSLATSYVGVAAPSAVTGSFWLGGGPGAAFDHTQLMGGGLAVSWTGGMGPGNGFGRQGPFGWGQVFGLFYCPDPSFSAATGRVTCSTQTLPNGLTVSSSAAFTDASGNVQQAFDTATTNTVNAQNSVTGTLTFSADSGHGRGAFGPGWGLGRGAAGLLLGDTATIVSASTNVTESSNQTVSGLAAGSTQRTVNGTSAGTESTTGTSSIGAFSATRTVGDTTTGLVVPVSTGKGTYPTAGTVIRSMQVSASYAGQTPATQSRREVVTYNGSATATVVITENGTTKTCTQPLPRGPLSCQ